MEQKITQIELAARMAKRLPEDIKRFIFKRGDREVYVISSTDFEQLFSLDSRDEYGCVFVEQNRITCKCADPEDLAEDVVILASGGIDLNNPDLNL